MTTSLSAIYKHIGDFVSNSLVDQYAYESTILNFHGQMLVISFDRIGVGNNISSRITVRDYPTANVLASNLWLQAAGQPLPHGRDGGITGTAIIINGTIHIFGTTYDSCSIIHSTLNASFVPSPAYVVYTFTDAIANLGICAVPGGFVMSVEKNLEHSTVFLKSTDPNLAAWVPFGNPFTPGGYLGSPKITYLGETFYLTYLYSSAGKFLTGVMKSINELQTFEVSPIPLLYPDLESDGISASDLTLAQDVAGNVQGVYLGGDQNTWANLRNVSYLGSLAQLFNGFF